MDTVSIYRENATDEQLRAENKTCFYEMDDFIKTMVLKHRISVGSVLYALAVHFRELCGVVGLPRSRAEDIACYFIQFHDFSGYGKYGPYSEEWNNKHGAS